MHPLKFTKKKVNRSVVLGAVYQLVRAIAGTGDVVAVYLFGSVADCRESDQSDIDLLVVTAGRQEIRSAQEKLRGIQKMTPFPVDLVWVEQAQFDRKKSLGGVCMIAFEDGHCLYQKEIGVIGDERTPF